MAQDELPDLLRNSDYHGLLADVSGPGGLHASVERG